jgi:hypothetical protein
LDGNSKLFVSGASSYRHSPLAVPISLSCSYAVYLGILSFYFVIIFLFFPETKRMSAEDASVGKQSSEDKNNKEEKTHSVVHLCANFPVQCLTSLTGSVEECSRVLGVVAPPKTPKPGLLIWMMPGRTSKGTTSLSMSRSGLDLRHHGCCRALSRSWWIVKLNLAIETLLEYCVFCLWRNADGI